MIENVVCDRAVSDAIPSVGRAMVKDFHSVLPAFTLNKTLAALPSAQRTTTSMHVTARAQAMQADANAAVLAVWRALDLRPVTASPAWNIRSTTTLLTGMKIHGYAASVLADFLQLLSFVFVHNCELCCSVFYFNCDCTFV